jgi:serine/threonine protein phosphatase PrpC
VTAEAAAMPSRSCPRCAFPLHPEDHFCEECGLVLEPRAGAVVSAVPEAAGLGAVGRAQAEAGDEIGGVDADSVQFDAAARPSGPSRRPGVKVVDVDLDTVPARCSACSGDIASDGYCERCGTSALRLRDHWVERPASWVALVCDRGVRHAINQDGAAVGASSDPGSFAALVVCDGVSSAARSEVASLAAARAARDFLVAPRQADVGRSAESSAVPSRASLLSAAMREAGAAAQDRAVSAASDPPEYNPPACTFAAAVIDESVLVAGWVGDSRVYWIPDGDQPLQLSEDDSLAGEAIRQGLPRADAERSPHAHSITRWLGLDAPDPVPRIAVRRIAAPAWVLVCSDGLWNYCSEATEMGGLVQRCASEVGQDVAGVAEALVAWAIEQGGHDNIAVALARMG